MQLVSLVGFAVFFVVSLAIGVRLLLLWNRTGQLPELLIGAAILAIGPVALSAHLVAAAFRESRPALASGVALVAILSAATGTVTTAVFNGRVFRPEARWARLAPVGFYLLIVLALGWEAGVTGFADPLELGPGALLASGLLSICMLWGATESLLYWRQMRRRLELGLAEPLITHRFLLWGLGIGAAGWGSALSLVGQTVLDRGMADVPLLMLSNSLHGLVAAVLMWVAFVPPVAYRRWLAARA
jgi:hypothetical protein